MWQRNGYIMYLELGLLLIKWKYIMDTYDLNMLGCGLCNDPNWQHDSIILQCQTTFLSQIYNPSATYVTSPFPHTSHIWLLNIVMLSDCVQLDIYGLIRHGCSIANVLGLGLIFINLKHSFARSILYCGGWIKSVTIVHVLTI